MSGDNESITAYWWSINTAIMSLRARLDGNGPKGDKGPFSLRMEAPCRVAYNSVSEHAGISSLEAELSKIKSNRLDDRRLVRTSLALKSKTPA